VTFGRFAISPVASCGVAACVVVAVASAAVEVSRSVAKLSRRAEHNATLSFSDRAFALGNNIYPNQALLYEARARIPPRGKYRVEVGTKPIDGATDWTQPYALTFARYFLLPRLPDPAASWVICLGCDARPLGKATVVWDDHDGSSLLRIRT
jgi:hypothetical protein